MAEQTKSGTSETDVPKREPGILVGVEWTKKGTVDCSEDEQRAIKALLTKLNNRDSAAFREMIVRTWEKRLFDRGFQHILPVRNGGWSLPAQGTGYGYGEENSKSSFETNIYNSYNQMITSALTREVPTVRFKSKKPDDDGGITAAQSANAIKERIIRSNEILVLWEDLGRFLYTDGLGVIHTYYTKDGQQFGYKPDPEEAVPEDEEKISEGDESGEKVAGTDQAEDSTGDDQGDRASGEPGGVSGQSRETDSDDARSGSDENGDGEAESSDANKDSGPDSPAKEANGREVIEVGGKLEWKFPIRKNKLSQCGYAMCAKEIDVVEGRARFPEMADKITPGNGGPGGDDIARLARINVEQGMMNSFNTQDSQENEVTWQRAWLRPWQLLEIDQEHREALINKFPRGLYVNFCGDVFCEARDQSMDDCLSLCFAQSGDGMNRAGWGDWLLPIQKILNNWMELANDYFVRGVPATWMDNEMFNVEAVNDQVNQVGERHPFQREPQVTMDQVVWQETPPQFPEQLTAFIQDFKGDLAQLLTGAFPALFGGDTGSNDTMGGIELQRDQALGRLGLPWRRIKSATAITMMQAVQCLAANHDEPISITGKISVTIEMSDLKGDMDCYPDVDENFPETATQKQNRLVGILQDANANPVLGTIMDEPDNLELMQEAFALEGFVVPDVEARDKQLGEIEVMLGSGPIPNPAIMDLEKKIADATAVVQQQLQINPQAAAAAGAAIPQLQQQLQQLQQTTPFVSSEPIDVDLDNHLIEAKTTLRFLNGPRGRSMKHGNSDEQESFANLKLHYIEHRDAQAQKDAAAKAAAQPALPPKPPSISANVKDMTPEEAAQALAQANIKSDPQNIATTRAAKEAAAHPHEAVPVVQ
jgi:hypothetical protein